MSRKLRVECLAAHYCRAEGCNELTPQCFRDVNSDEYIRPTDGYCSEHYSVKVEVPDLARDEVIGPFSDTGPSGIRIIDIPFVKEMDRKLKTIRAIIRMDINELYKAAERTDKRDINNGEPIDRFLIRKALAGRFTADD